MNKKIASRRLQLNKETLRSLTTEQLGQAAGGSILGGVIVRWSNRPGCAGDGGNGVVDTNGTHSYPATACPGSINIGTGGLGGG